MREILRTGALVVLIGLAAATPKASAAVDGDGPFAAALEAGLAAPELAAVYAERAGAPIWLAGDGERAAALIAALRGADAHALPTERYAPDALAAAAAAADPAARGAAEARLTNAYLRYARDVASGVLEPRRVAPLIKVDPPRPDPAALLRAAAVAPDMAAHLAALAPADPDYAALQALYARFAAKAGADPWGAPVPAGPTLRRGDAGPRVAALRARLQALDAAAGEAAGEMAAAGAPTGFDAALEAAVRAFQRRHGLIEDGVVGPATLRAINAGPEARLGQIAVNLERLRWLNRPLGHRRIVVNQAAFTVTLSEGDATLFHERVVIGRVQEQTPEFSDEMAFLVLNPTWFVPRSIATRDLLPQLQRDPTILGQRNMRLVRSDGGLLPEDPSAHDFSVYDRASFPYRIRQAPSQGNALGRVKFMFPNADNIYLHDTPQKNLFDRDERAYSWGCVRVRDPLRLAEVLLAPQRADARDFIDRMLATGRERHVTLDRPVPIHLTYRSVTFGPDGAARFHGDVYDRDGAVLRALRAAGVVTPGG